MSEELWQAYDERGEPIQGKSLTKLDARKGALHGASHVWLWSHQNGELKILLQRRARDKSTWPGMWDISAAGHIDFAETPSAAALRETKEELGLAMELEKLTLLFVHRVHMVAAGSDIIENEFQFVYGVSYEMQPVLSTDDDEVAETKWVTVSELQSLLAGKAHDEQLVPNGEAYYATLFKEITRIQSV